MEDILHIESTSQNLIHIGLDLLCFFIAEVSNIDT